MILTTTYSIDYDSTPFVIGDDKTDALKTLRQKFPKMVFKQPDEAKFRQIPSSTK